MSDEPKWLIYDAIIALHHQGIKQFGGKAGTKDKGSLEIAIERPFNKWQYGTGDLHTIAAAYAYGLIKNHPFHDGNKRIALNACFLFLRLNGAQFTTSEETAYLMTDGLASGEVTEEEFSSWLQSITLE